MTRLTVILAVLALLWLWLILPRLPRRDMGAFLRRDYAHRGLWDKERPENSLSAFRRAVQAGYGVELDVRLTADGSPIVFHDASLMRMCGVEGSVHGLTAAELAALRLSGTEEAIPTLAEALAAMGAETPVILEIKPGPRLRTLCRRVLPLVKAYSGPLCVESFDPRALFWFRLHAPDIPRGQLIVCPARPFRLRDIIMSSLLQNVLGRPDFLSVSGEGRLNPAFRLLRRLGTPFAVWTVRTPEEHRRHQARFALQIFEGFSPKR